MQNEATSELIIALCLRDFEKGPFCGLWGFYKHTVMLKRKPKFTANFSVFDTFAPESQGQELLNRCRGWS